jgi:hypothetical protein
VENAQVLLLNIYIFTNFYGILGSADNFTASEFVLFLAGTPKKNRFGVKEALA